MRTPFAARRSWSAGSCASLVLGSLRQRLNTAMENCSVRSKRLRSAIRRRRAGHVPKPIHAVSGPIPNAAQWLVVLSPYFSTLPLFNFFHLFHFFHFPPSPSPSIALPAPVPC